MAGRPSHHTLVTHHHHLGRVFPPLLCSNANFVRSFHFQREDTIGNDTIPQQLRYSPIKVGAMTLSDSRVLFSLIATMFLILLLFSPKAQATQVSPSSTTMSQDEAQQLGEEFGLIVGEVDEELREYLGLQKAEGVVVFEVIGGKPADLAGIKAKSIIKEIDSREIKNLHDFGTALKLALVTQNFSLVTYEPAKHTDQGITGGIQFHFVRSPKT